MLVFSFSQRLKTLRHPSILKYLNSCVAGETVHLIVEYVTPLSQVLPQQTELEICCGLQNVLGALDFIHSKVVNSLCLALNDYNVSHIYKRPA